MPKVVRPTKHNTHPLDSVQPAPSGKKPLIARIHPSSQARTRTILGVGIFYRDSCYEVSPSQADMLRRAYVRHDKPESGPVFQIGTAEELKAYDNRALRDVRAARGTPDEPIRAAGAPALEQPTALAKNEGDDITPTPVASPAAPKKTTRKRR